VTLKERTEALARVPVFAGLSRRSLERIARIAKDLELRPGQVLIEPRAKGSGMFVVLEGAVTASTRGKRSRELGPGDIVGELALLTADERRTARVRATTPVRCLAIARGDFRRILTDEPRVAIQVLETVAARLASPL
jgi:CRP/FNR family transcriptional regulator, cyclic AMP receptor protein